MHIRAGVQDRPRRGAAACACHAAHAHHLPARRQLAGMPQPLTASKKEILDGIKVSEEHQMQTSRAPDT